MIDFLQGLQALLYYSTRSKQHKSRVQTRDLVPTNIDAQVEEGRKRAVELERLRKLNYRLYGRYYRRR